MAELILTEDEKQLSSWLDLSDEALGKVVRKTCLTLKNAPDDATEMQKIWKVACAMLLCNLTYESDGSKLEFIIDGLLDGNNKRGDWKITIEQLNNENKKPDESSWVRDFSIRLNQARRRWSGREFNIKDLKLFYLLGREDQAYNGVHTDRSIVDRAR